MSSERAVRAALALLSALALAGCVSETKDTSPLVWRDGSPAPAAGHAAAPSRIAPPPESPAATRRREPREGETIEIPPDVLKQLMGFVNRAQILLGDRIEVDASRIPFQVAMVPLADERAVEIVELAAPALKATGILMRSRVERPLVESDYCRLRVGDGVDLAAGREIQVRTYTSVDPDRPAFISIRASGHASYKDVASGRRIQQSTISMTAEIVNQGGNLVFREQVR